MCRKSNVIESTEDETDSIKNSERNDSIQGLVEVKRTVGLFSAVAFIVGSIIGSGIFVNPGGVLERSGSVGLSLVIWAACGLLSILGALCYAELGTLNQKTGGEFVYFIDGLSNLHKFWGPLPAFLYAWISAFLMNPAGGAASCLSCASYTVYPILTAFEICLEKESEDLVVKLVAIIYLCLMVALNCYSAEWTLRLNNLMTTAKLAAIAIIIGCGIYQLAYDWEGNTQYLSQGFEGSTTNFGVIATAFYSGLWAFYGWNSLNFITEEVKDPSANLPRAIIAGISLTTGCYLAVNIAYLTVLSPTEIINSNAVAMEVGNKMLGPMAFVIPLAVTMSTFGMMLLAIFFYGRLIFAFSREGHMVAVLSYLHLDSRTPFPAIVFNGVLTVVMILSKDMASLMDFFSFLVWIFYVLAMIMILILRKTRPEAPRPYKVPLVIPVIVIMVGSFLVVAPIISDPTWEYFYVLLAAVLGIVVYIPFVYYKYSFSTIIDRVTRIVQLTFYVGPPLKNSLD